MRTLQQQLIDKYITDKAVEALLKLQEFRNTGYTGDTLIIVGDTATGKSSLMKILQEWQAQGLIEEEYTFIDPINPNHLNRKWQICTVSSYYADDMEEYDQAQTVWLSNQEFVADNLVKPQRIIAELQEWVTIARETNRENYKKAEGNKLISQQSSNDQQKFYFGLYQAFSQVRSRIKYLTGEEKSL